MTVAAEGWSPIALPLAFGLAASGATLLGGLLGLRLAKRIVLVLGLTAGIVLGVALFDLLPEALSLAPAGGSARGTFGWVAAGIGGYLLFERLLGGMRQATRWRAHLGPATLTLHSLVDGLGIGLAFQAGSDIGWVVAAAVLSHDLVDGVNVVGLTLASRDEGAARRWLLANSAAPLLGAALGTQLPVSPGVLALVLAAFGGAFLHISVGELLPRSYRLDPRPRTTAASFAGLALIAAATGLVR